MKAKSCALKLAIALLMTSSSSYAAWQNAALIEEICSEGKRSLKQNFAKVEEADYPETKPWIEDWFTRILDHQQEAYKDICSSSKEPETLLDKIKEYKRIAASGRRDVNSLLSSPEEMLELFIKIWRTYSHNLLKIEHLTTPLTPYIQRADKAKVEEYYGISEEFVENVNLFCGLHANFTVDYLADKYKAKISKYLQEREEEVERIELTLYELSSNGTKRQVYPIPQDPSIEVWSMDFAESDVTPTFVPKGFQLRKGEMNISYPREGYLLINQTSDYAIATWEHFSIGKDAIVELITPSSEAVTKFYRSGIFPSYYFGSLISNCTLHLHNPMGTHGMLINYESEEEMREKRSFTRMNKGSLGYDRYMDHHNAVYPKKILSTLYQDSPANELEKEFNHLRSRAESERKWKEYETKTKGEFSKMKRDSLT